MRTSTERRVLRRVLERVLRRVLRRVLETSMEHSACRHGSSRQAIALRSLMLSLLARKGSPRQVQQPHRCCEKTFLTCYPEDAQSSELRGALEKFGVKRQGIGRTPHGTGWRSAGAVVPTAEAPPSPAPAQQSIGIRVCGLSMKSQGVVQKSSSASEKSAVCQVYTCNPLGL